MHSTDTIRLRRERYRHFLKDKNMHLKKSLTVLATICLAGSATFAARIEPLVRVIDLNVGQTRSVTLHDGNKATVKLLGLEEHRDSVRNAVRRAVVKVEVNDRVVELVSSTYNLPGSIAGVQIDCPVTKGYIANSSKANAWGLAKDARLRLWPADSPWIRPETFVYPVRQKWFANDTQMGNVPCYVNACDSPAQKGIYYHYGLDFGGSEEMVDVVAATDGLVVSVAGKVLPGHEEDTPIAERYDVVYLMDDRGWYYRYSHLSAIATPVILGKRVKMGSRIGQIGKEGGSGGWSHLHFDIKCRQPSGMWGTQDAYAFAWQAYQQQYRPDIIAVARPHHLVYTGEKVLLDATKSWTSADRIEEYEWTFCNGSEAPGPQIERSYDRAGQYSEIVRVTDSAGKAAYDFAIVCVIDKEHPDRVPPAIHANYYPTRDIKAGDKVTFKVRSFATQHGSEVWDFGDDSEKVEVKSDGNASQHNPDGYAVTSHRYEKPGDYIVTVRRSNDLGYEAIAHLHVRVE